MYNTEFIEKVKKIKKELKKKDEKNLCYVYSRNDDAYFDIHEVYLDNSNEIIIDSE